jgi:hypothetical protein
VQNIFGIRDPSPTYPDAISTFLVQPIRNFIPIAFKVFVNKYGSFYRYEHELFFIDSSYQAYRLKFSDKLSIELKTDIISSNLMQVFVEGVQRNFVKSNLKLVGKSQIKFSLATNDVIIVGVIFLSVLIAVACLRMISIKGVKAILDSSTTSSEKLSQILRSAFRVTQSQVDEQNALRKIELQNLK